jgi:hypothetical protein
MRGDVDSSAETAPCAFLLRVEKSKAPEEAGGGVALGNVEASCDTRAVGCPPRISCVVAHLPSQAAGEGAFLCTQPDSAKGIPTDSVQIVP